MASTASQADILSTNDLRDRDVLKHELEANPDSPSLELDLAIAYFVQGQESDETQYKNALNVLDKLLLRQPGNTVARFNRAIVREHLHMDQEAAVDWNAVLQNEMDVGWKTEAEQHLKHLQGKNSWLIHLRGLEELGKSGRRPTVILLMMIPITRLILSSP